MTSHGGTPGRLRRPSSGRCAICAASAETSISSTPKRLPTQLPRKKPMSNKASSLKSQIEEFSRRQGIAGEMDQNLVKEAIHLHLLSAMSDARILRHPVFQGGTTLRLCYRGDL